MSDLFSGLGKFGLGGLKDIPLYEPKKKQAEQEEKMKEPVYNEEDFLFDKSQICPVCDHSFTERTVRSNKVRVVGTDRDLRPRYEQMDAAKYDVISCPRCGYSVLSRFFMPLLPTQIKLVREQIGMAFVAGKERPSVYSYEFAFERYQLCLASAIVKRAKDSEKAYICLKTGWILRGMAEHLDQGDPDYKEQLRDIRGKERDFIKHAYDGFIMARTSEGFPMCGMDDVTLDYLITALAITLEEYDVASKMISGILVSKTANARMKDKARDLKDVIIKMKAEKTS